MVQCWTLVELGLRVKESIDITKILDDNTDADRGNSMNLIKNKTEDIIKIGRTCIVIFITSTLTGLCIYFGIKTSNTDKKERSALIRESSDYISYCFFALSVLLVVCVIWLVALLKKKRDQVSRSSIDKQAFNNEIRTLWIILSVFSSTYLARGVWDTFYNPTFTHFWSMMAAVLTGLVWDFFPCMLIMVFHHHNFKERLTANDTQSIENKDSFVENDTTIRTAA